MSLLDTILSQVSGNATVAGLAERVGLSPEQVEMAVAALGKAHHEPGDTVTQASDESGLPQDKLSEIVGHLGGEGALGPISSILRQQGSGGLMGSLSKFL
jgi:hypothetical protein